jgi:crotonobetaine/carnitine-CoA ligase
MNVHTVNAAFELAVQRHPEELFLDCSGSTLSYAEADTDVERLASGLQELGVARGDRVIAQLDNGVDAVVAWLAALRIGAIYCPLNTAYKGEFLRHEVADTQAKIALVEAAYLPRFQAVWDALPDLAVIVARIDAADVGSSTARRPIGWNDVIAGGGVADRGEARPNDLACLMFTSGTTGPSKACMISHAYLCDVGRRILELSARTREELNWTPLPVFHLYASSIVVSTMMIGGAVSLAPRFSVQSFWPEVERTGARIVSLLGTMSTLLAHAPDTDVIRRCRGQLRATQSAPMSDDIQEIWQERFGVAAPGINSYGMTEAALMTSLLVGQPSPPGTAGQRNDSFDVRIVDRDDHELPVDAVGEIVCRPLRPGVMFDGYWNRPEATVKATRNLWFHTGDLGRFDKAGFLHFEDRKKDYIRRRGENISSATMEAAFANHPAIFEVAVHAVASKLGEDDVKVTAVLRPGHDISEEELCRWSADHVPYFAVPRYVEFRDELPKNLVGRTLKYALRDQGRTPTTWDREEAGITLARH